MLLAFYLLSTLSTAPPLFPPFLISFPHPFSAPLSQTSLSPPLPPPTSPTFSGYGKRMTLSPSPKIQSAKEAVSRGSRPFPIIPSVCLNLVPTRVDGALRHLNHRVQGCPFTVTLLTLGKKCYSYCLSDLSQLNQMFLPMMGHLNVSKKQALSCTNMSKQLDCKRTPLYPLRHFTYQLSIQHVKMENVACSQ